MFNNLLTFFPRGMLPPHHHRMPFRPNWNSNENEEVERWLNNVSSLSFYLLNDQREKWKKKTKIFIKTMSARVTAHTYRTKTTNDSNSENRISLYRNLILSFFSFFSILFLCAFVLCEWVNEWMSEWARVCTCLCMFVSVCLLLLPFCVQSNSHEHVQAQTIHIYALRLAYMQRNKINTRRWTNSGCFFGVCLFLRSAFRKKNVDKFTKFKTDKYMLAQKFIRLRCLFLVIGYKKTKHLWFDRSRKRDFNETHAHTHAYWTLWYAELTLRFIKMECLTFSYSNKLAKMTNRMATPKIIRKTNTTKNLKENRIEFPKPSNSVEIEALDVMWQLWFLLVIWFSEFVIKIPWKMWLSSTLNRKRESIATADIGNGYFHLKFDIGNASECTPLTIVCKTTHNLTTKTEINQRKFHHSSPMKS